jgi:two-component system, LytTR family, sensor kinase
MNAVPAASKSPGWAWIASIWLGIALFDATQTIFVMRSEGMSHAWAALFATLLLSWAPWALATPLVLHLGRQYSPVRVRPLSTWLTHLSACMGINLVSGAWSAGLEELLNPWAKSLSPEPFVPLWLDKVYNGLLQCLFLYAAILTVSYLLEARGRFIRQQVETARLDEQLSKAQLESLRRQIEPHFLFNALNAIAGLVREKRNDAAVTAIAALSEFLRKVIEHSDRQEVPLGEEVQFLQKYLDIQKVRFAERLQLSVDVPQELFSVQVPSLILQPIVENAVKHGIAKQARGGWIRVAAFRSNHWLTLRVYNDGPSLPADWERMQSGIGIVNVRTRLQTLYGDGFEFSLRNQAAGVEVLVSMPVRER